MSVQIDEKMLKLARMIEQGIPETELASILGVSAEQLSKVLESDGYKQALAQVMNVAFDKQELLNNGWDGVEEFAIANVLGHLQGPTPDPEYALRAAAYANKAIRRGKNSNSPILVQPNMQSVINLNATYVGKLEQNFQVSQRQVQDMERKQTNMMSVNGVKSLLGVTKDITSDAIVIDDMEGITFSNA